MNRWPAMWVLKAVGSSLMPKLGEGSSSAWLSQSRAVVSCCRPRPRRCRRWHARFAASQAPAARRCWPRLGCSTEFRLRSQRQSRSSGIPYQSMLGRTWPCSGTRRAARTWWRPRGCRSERRLLQRSRVRPRSREQAWSYFLLADCRCASALYAEGQPCSYARSSESRILALAAK